MEYEVMEALAKEEAKKHSKVKKFSTSFDKDLRQEITTVVEENDVKKVVVLMPKQAAYPDPTPDAMDSLRRYAAENKQTVFEISLSDESENSDNGGDDTGSDDNGGGKRKRK